MFIDDLADEFWFTILYTTSFELYYKSSNFSDIIISWRWLALRVEKLEGTEVGFKEKKSSFNRDRPLPVTQESDISGMISWVAVNFATSTISSE